ncbi:voltage gated chloride channel-domain-containing protein [Hyaloraphidium curvatum]|nr:voltage gated chloride channel-domain-containing protein [Hyaloraphidium curvatum]
MIGELSCSASQSFQFVIWLRRRVGRARALLGGPASPRFRGHLAGACQPMAGTDEPGEHKQDALEEAVPIPEPAEGDGGEPGAGDASRPRRSPRLRLRQLKEDLKRSYAEARSLEFDYELVESLDLEEPDLYFRSAVGRRGGRTPTAAPGPDTVPPLPARSGGLLSPDTLAGNDDGEETEQGVRFDLPDDDGSLQDGKEALPSRQASAVSSIRTRPSARSIAWQRRLKDFGRYLVIIFLGTLVSCVYKFVFYASEAGFDWRFELMERLLGIEGYYSVSKPSFALLEPKTVQVWGQLNKPNFAAAYFAAVGTSLLFTLPAAVFIAFLKPVAAGAGMPEVIALLNGDLQLGAFQFSTLILKIAGAIGIVASGLFSGFDGPIIHIGSIMAYLMTFFLWGPPFFYTEEPDKDRHNPGLQTLFRRSVSKDEVDEVRHAELHKHTLDFTTLGACAAISSAFWSPLAGVTFALEEAITHFEPSFIAKALLVGTWAFLMLSFLNKLDWLNPHSFSIFTVNASCFVRTEYVDVLLWAAMGLFAGIAGHCYNVAVTKIRTFRIKWTWPAWPGRALLDLVLVTLVSMAFVVFLPLAFDTCTPLRHALNHVDTQRGACTVLCDTRVVPPTTSINPRCHLFIDKTSTGENVCIPDDMDANIFTMVISTFDSVSLSICPSMPSNGTYFFDPFNATTLQELAESTSLPYIKMGAVVDPETGENVICAWQMRSLLWEFPERVIQNLLLRGVYNVFDWQVLFAFFAVYLCLSMLVNGVCLPTDLVIPNLIVGASFGRLCALGVNVLKEQAGITLVDPGVYAMLGMSALFAGTSRMSITVALIAIETTFELTHLPAILVVVTVATITGNALGHSLYHMEIHNRRIPYLPVEPAPDAKDIMAREPVSAIMSRPVRVLVGIAPTRGEIKTALSEVPKRCGFPLVDGHGRVLGLVLRERLESILASADPTLDDLPVNLSTIMNPSPTCVPSTMSVSKAFATFRNLKLRHMIVVDSYASGKVVGIVTRRRLVDAEHDALHAGH